jgi:hypothetical protein
MAARSRRFLGGSCGRVCALAWATSCLHPSTALPPEQIDPGATFVAHSVHAGFAIDRFEARSAALDAAGWRGAGPTFLLRADGRTLAALALSAPASVEVRPASGASIVATIEPSWEDQAIRLAVHTPDGVVLRTSTFDHVGGTAGASVLARSAATTVDLRGVFRAELRDGAGAPAGWFQVTLASPGAPPIFEGALPSDARLVGPALVIALGSEIDWIQDHAIDVYRGSDGRRGLGGRGR